MLFVQYGEKKIVPLLAFLIKTISHSPLHRTSCLQQASNYKLYITIALSKQLTVYCRVVLYMLLLTATVYRTYEQII